MSKKDEIAMWLRGDKRTKITLLEEYFWGTKPANFPKPPRCVLEIGLSKRSSGCDTPMHAAARSGMLDQIPSELITTTALSVANDMGSTPMHLAAASGYLHQVPKAAITKTILEMKNDNGYTPIMLALDTGQLDQLLGVE